MAPNDLPMSRIDYPTGDIDTSGLGGFSSGGDVTYATQGLVIDGDQVHTYPNAGPGCGTGGDGSVDGGGA